MKPVKVKDVHYHGNGSEYLFRKRGGFEIVEDLDEADIVVLNGGSDIATEIYKQNRIRQLWYKNEGGPVDLEPTPTFISPRDKMEIIAYQRAKAQGKFIFGICRGAQLINCLEGGTLWQHVNNHESGHPIMDVKTHQIYRATSVHHQMLRVPKGAQVIAVANEATFKIDANEQKRCQTHGRPIDQGEDPEIVWFPKARALGVQGHPEYAPDSLFADYCFQLIHTLRIDGVWPAKATSSVAAL